MLVILLVAVLCGLLYLYLSHKQKYWKNRNVPHKTPNLIFGNLPVAGSARSETPAKYFGNLYNEFDGPYFGYYAFAKPWLVIKDPELIKRILIKDNHVFPNRFVVSDETIDPILTNSLLGIKTPNWKILRNKLSPAFTSGKIKEMQYLMVECGENLIENIKTHLQESIEVKNLSAKYTTDVIASCAFGIAANSFVNEDGEFLLAGRKLFQRSGFRAIVGLIYFFAPVLVKIFRCKFFERGAVNFLRNVFNDTIKKREETKIKRNDLIDILIKLKNAETDDVKFKFYGDRLVAQGVIFFGAGHETTSSVISFTLHELSLNFAMQHRLRMEINESIKKYGELSYEAIQDMKYLHMIICESLRKYPLTPFISRHCEEDYKIPETGLVIEKGTQILISQYGLHWDPKYFPQPEIYDPERFNQENKSKLPNYVYLPFGDGPRNCIGERFALQTSKLGIILIIKNFQVVRSADTRDPLVFGRSALLHAIPGVFVAFQNLTEEEF